MLFCCSISDNSSYFHGPGGRLMENSFNPFKRSEASAGNPLALSTELASSILESLPIGLIVFGYDQSIILANQAARDLLPGAGDLTKAMSRVALESNYEDWDAVFRKVLETGIPQRFSITVPAVDDQPEAYLEIAVNPLRSTESAQVLGGLMLLENVTARTSIERRLAVSERLAAVGKMAARVAHELNNPLDGILRYLNMAMRLTGEQGNAKLKEYLEKARSGIRRMGEIISTLLEFSRSTPSMFEQATINKIVEDALAAMEGRAREANVTTVCNFHQKEMPVVRGSNIFQVFCNLIKNAIEAMPEGGTLTITTAVTGADVVVRFEDCGVGLPEPADKIFEAFYTTKEPGQGTGLGLAVCRELIEKMDGQITAERRHPRGTTMTVRVPVRSCTTDLPNRSLRRIGQLRTPPIEVAGVAPPGPDQGRPSDVSG